MNMLSCSGKINTKDKHCSSSAYEYTYLLVNVNNTYTRKVFPVGVM